MDAELQQLLREIEAEVPDTAQALRTLLSGGMSGALGSGWIRAIAESIVEMARRLPPGVADKILRALAMILRVLGRQMPTFFGGALTGGAAGGAAAGAGGAAAGSGAGTAVGTGLQIAPGAAEAGAAGAGVTIGAAVFMLFAIGVMTYRTYRELTAELGVGDASGTPCSTGRGGELWAAIPHTLTTYAWSGQTDSLKQAISEAWTNAARMRSNCEGRCTPGRHCLPIVAIRDVQQSSTFPWAITYTHLVYTLPCFCVNPDEYWAQFRWDMLPDEDKPLWEELGRNEGNWNEGTRERAAWAGLDREQRSAAERLGFDEASWSGSS
jgi:hypothetical protein